MRTNTTLKTKAMSILLAIVMLLGMMPMSALAADESTVITITNDNVNDASDAYLVDDSTLWLGGGTGGMAGTYSFVLGPNPDESAFTFFGVQIGGFSTVQGGKAVFKYITNFGTISGGSFDPESNGVLFVKNTDTGDISGGTFNGNQEAILSVENYGIISGGTFYGTVTSHGTISNGIFNDNVHNCKNNGTITGGTFNAEVKNDGTISGGTFNGLVTNYGTITGGTFTGKILNMGGTVSAGVNGTVVEGGDLAITMQTLGTGSITVKQNGIDIPSGKAGETYNVAASGGTLVGLYLLTEDETVPAGNYAIESDFRAVLGGLGGYDFDMPNEAVTIVAVFDDYVPTEISIWPHIIGGTDAESLEAAEWINYEIAPLTSFTEEITLPGEIMESFITVGGERYDFAGFIMSEYDEATDNVSYSLSQTFTIAAEPAQGTEEWDEWYTPISDGLMAAYMLHTHSYSAATCTTPATCSCGATTGGVDSTNHTYDEDGYQKDANGHWQLCSNENCPDADKGKTASTPHTYDGDTDAVCDTCDYTRLILVADKTVVSGNGTVTLTSSLSVFQLVCSDERYKDYISGSGKNWSFQMKNNVTTDLTFTVTFGSQTASCTVSFVQDPDALILTPSSTTLVGSGTITLTGNKDITGITCSNQSYETDISGSGQNWQFVMNRNADVNLWFEATAADGETALCWITFTSSTHTHSYTPTYDNVNHWDVCSCGDKQNEAKHTYSSDTDTTCDCGYNRGLFVTNDDGKDFFEVGFIPGDGVTLPDDAELVVEDHYPSLAPIASTIVPTAETEYVDIPENNISRLEDKADSYMTGGYMIGEIVVIDGEKYMVCEGVDVLVHLIRLSDNAKFTYSVQGSTLVPGSTSYDVEIQTNRTIVINGAKYDVPATIDYNDIEQFVMLYVDGVKAGLYIPSNNEASFCEGYDPETLKAQQDDNDLGSVTIPADYNNAAIADFAPGKTYKVSVIGANDISVEGLTEVNGTVTQTFKIPDKLAGDMSVTYVAVHDTNPYADDLAGALRMLEVDPGNENWMKIYEDNKRLYDKWEEEHGSGVEFGTVTLSLDGLTLTATHTGVRGFSPFIVYAFVEADEPEYKELSATLHTEHTYENGKCTVCQAVDPDYVPEGSSPQTGDNSNMALWIALLFISGGAVITLTVVDRKRRTANR